MHYVFLDFAKLFIHSLCTNVFRRNYCRIDLWPLLCLQGLFYWSSGEKVVMEEYDASQSLYHHNEMFFSERAFVALNVWHNASQPTPGTHPDVS